MVKAPHVPGSLAKGPKSGMARGMTREKAEALALQGLSFLVSDPDRLSRFLTLTGIDPSELTGWDGNPQIQAAVLEHLLEDESLLLVFAAEAGVLPESVGPAQAMLSGEG